MFTSAVPVVRADLQPEGRAGPDHLQESDLGRQRLAIPDGGNAAKEGLQRPRPLLLDAGLVHAGREEISHLLPLGALGGGPVRRGAFEDVFHNGECARLHLLVHAVLAVFGRDGRALLPGAHRVLVEIRAGTDGGVHVGGIEAARGLRRHSGRRAEGEDEQDGDGEANASHVITSVTNEGLRATDRLHCAKVRRWHTPSRASAPRAVYREPVGRFALCAVGGHGLRRFRRAQRTTGPLARPWAARDRLRRPAS